MNQPPTARVLFVEDDEDVRRVVTRVLRRSGFTVTEAEDGRIALDAFGDGTDFDLVVLDLTLPKLLGESVLEEIRRRSALPVLVLTGRVPDEELEGATLILEKPVPPARLLGELRRLTGG